MFAWKEEHKAWMSTSLTNLDAESMEKRVGTLRLDMVKTAKKFEKAGFPHVKEAAMRIKEDVENFRVHMPLIEVLSVNGMRDRHFVQVRETDTVEGERGLSPSLPLPVSLPLSLSCIIIN